MLMSKLRFIVEWTDFKVQWTSFKTEFFMWAKFKCRSGDVVRDF